MFNGVLHGKVQDIGVYRGKRRLKNFLNVILVNDLIMLNSERGTISTEQVLK